VTPGACCPEGRRILKSLHPTSLGDHVPEWLYVTLRFLHPGAWLVAFLAAPVALLSTKGERRHILAGRICALGMATGAVAGILLALIRTDGPVVELALMGFLAASFITTGYLSPRISRGSEKSYRWDRALTAVGILASLGLIGYDLPDITLKAPLQDGIVVGAFGLWIAGAHWRWQGAADAARWRVEHLTSSLAPTSSCGGSCSGSTWVRFLARRRR
jgi:uncharacterized membrane protein